MDAKPRLLELVAEKLRAKHYSLRTEQQYVGWIRRFVLHHGKRHPAEMAAAEIESFLTYLAVHRSVAASTQNQALSAILFLYRYVLEVDLPWLENIVRARRPARLPVVLSHHQVPELLARLDQPFHLVAQLLYGSGLRLLEALRLRVKDIDFDYAQILVRDGKGQKDRATILPRATMHPLRLHLATIKDQHRRAIRRGFGGVELPHALVNKYPRATTAWGWQYVFPAARPSRDPRSGAVRRHHLHETTVQRAVRDAARGVGILSLSARIRCGTPSPRICSSGAMTSAPCRSCSAIRTCAPPKSTLTS